MSNLQINMRSGAAASGGPSLGILTSAGNPWTIDESLARDLVNRGLATFANWPVPASGSQSSILKALTTGAGATLSPGYTGGATPWKKLFGPNELRQSPWGGSNELTTPSTAFAYTTQASPSNGPAMFRREGASMRIDGPIVLANTGNPTYGNLRSNTAGLSAGALLNTTIAVLVYVHKITAGALRLRVGVDSGNYVYYQWAFANGEVVEGWNVLLVHTGEGMGSGSDSPLGQHDFQTSASITDGWRVGAGTFSFTSSAIGYMALEMTGLTARSYFWFEGIYYGGFDAPMLTIGFDIQTSGLDLALSTMQKYGLVGYAAVPTGNNAPANPQYLWVAADVARLQSLFANGWDVVQHSVSHNSMGNYSDDTMLLAELEACREQIAAIGCNTGRDLFATPNNSFSNRLIALAARSGIKWMRHGLNAPLLLSSGLVGPANPLLQGAFSMANQNDAVRTLAYVDLLIKYGVSGHLYTHAIQVGASDSTNTNVAVFDAICAGIAQRIAAGQISNVTPSAYLLNCNAPQMDTVLANPNRLSLTAGASPFDLINTGYKPLRFQIGGGTVSAITYSRDGATFDSTGQTAGQFDVNPGDRLRITYSVVPTIVQYSI